MEKLNNKAANILLAGTESTKLKEMKRAANIDLNLKLESTIVSVLKRTTELSDDIIEEVTNSIILEFLENLSE